jgi:hypothetical protein
MSYANHDAGRWAEDNIAAAKRSLKPAQKRSQKGYAGAPDRLSPFHLRVFDILGMAFGGVYNAPILWDSIEWTGWGAGALMVPVKCGEIATVDGYALTVLVFLCLEARFRLAIRPRVSSFKLHFSARCESGSLASRHPNLAEAVSNFRAYLPSGHRVIYRVEPPAAPVPPSADR